MAKKVKSQNTKSKGQKINSRKKSKPPQNEERELKGLGGWLILPIIGLFWTIITFFMGFSIISEDPFIFIVDLLILCLVLYCVYLIFNKKKEAPKFMIILYIVSISSGVLIAAVMGDFFDLIEDIIVSLVVGIIWISYFRKSVRVKNTFIN